MTTPAMAANKLVWFLQGRAGLAGWWRPVLMRATVRLASELLYRVRQAFGAKLFLRIYCFTANPGRLSESRI